jgi:ABC-2 type transport system ATP-binding protein
LRRKFWDHFTTLKRDGRTLFVTTQYVGEAVYCDLVGVMVNGRLPVLDTPEGLRRRAYGGEVVEMYTQRTANAKDIKALRKLPEIKGSIDRIGDSNGIRVVVDQARKAIPALIAWCQQEYVTVESVEEYSAAIR